MITLEASVLADEMMKAFLTAGLNPESASHVVSSVIQTSLRGVDSHGINLFPHYYATVNGGRVNKAPQIAIKKTAVSSILVDADNAFGHHSGAVAMDKAIETAAETGIAAASVANSSHFGAAAYFGLRAAEAGMIGFAFTMADALVKAFGSTGKFFGTNPICFTAPLKDEGPFCLDMATSLVSWNKIKNYRKEDKTIPAHWAFDESGQSVTDPHQATCLNPIGEYKGYGLGAMIDILCAFLAGGPLSHELAPMFNTPLDLHRQVSHFFMAIDIKKFQPLDAFRDRLQGMVARMRALPPDREGTKPMAAGDPEKICFEQRSRDGIPITETVFNDFLAISKEFEKAIRDGAS